jgi:phage-related protein
MMPSGADDHQTRLTVVFFLTESKAEPVCEWLKALPVEEKRLIAEDIKTAQFGWRLGMPSIRELEPGVWAVHSRLQERIARVLFTVIGDQMVLLDGFIRKNRKSPVEAFDPAGKDGRKYELEND